LDNKEKSVQWIGHINGWHQIAEFFAQ